VSTLVALWVVQVKKQNGKFSEKRKKAQELFHKTEGHTLNVRLCVKFIEPFIFTGVNSMKTVLFYKGYSVYAS